MKRIAMTLLVFSCAICGLFILGGSIAYACGGKDEDFGCSGALPGASGYNDPPEHQPTRCERLRPEMRPLIGPDGKPVIGPDKKVVQMVVKYSVFAAEPVDMYVDLPPTPPPFADPVGASGLSIPGGKLVIGHGDARHQYQLWTSWCIDPVSKGTRSVKSAWVKMVTVENLTDDILLEVVARMSRVKLSWPTVSPKHGWQMVKVPLEIRGSVPAPISESMHAKNLTGELTVSITATPSHVVFSSGDDDAPVVCPIAQLGWDVPDPEHPSACSYTYRHSSVQRGGQPFKTNLITVWTLQTPDPAYNGAWPLPPETTDLPVAETQALVTG